MSLRGEYLQVKLEKLNITNQADFGKWLVGIPFLIEAGVRGACPLFCALSSKNRYDKRNRESSL